MSEILFKFKAYPSKLSVIKANLSFKRIFTYIVVMSLLINENCLVSDIGKKC